MTQANQQTVFEDVAKSKINDDTKTNVRVTAALLAAVCIGGMLIFCVMLGEKSAVASPSRGPTVSTLAGTGKLGFTNGPAASATFTLPDGVAVDRAGNLYVTDVHNNAIRKITAAGVVSTLAGTGARGFTNGPGASARFDEPTGVAVDSAGNVYVVDGSNQAIRKITAAGVVSTLAGTGAQGFTNGPGARATFHDPMVVAVDGAGNVYVAETGNYAIRKITAAGVVSTLAGTGAQGFTSGPAARATFRWPTGIAVDRAGNVYVVDGGNQAIRKITAAGILSTLAGTGREGAKNGPGASATFNDPAGIAVDSAGNVYVADMGNSAIRKITP
jgi:sugar lactone lactonase YvrE